MWAQLGMTWSQVWLTIVSAAGVYAAIIALSRVFGQRQFATVTSYDLAFNFAMGSLIGRTVLVRVSLLNAVVALCVMFLLHAGATWWHHRSGVVHDLIQNRPVLLVEDGAVVDEALRATGTSRLEVNQALRLAGVGSLEDVGAVILERNGQFSVLGGGRARTEGVFSEVVDVRS